jgi:hypothetical protein
MFMRVIAGAPTTCAHHSTWSCRVRDVQRNGRGGGFADRAGTSILLIRPAFWSALLLRFPWCLGAIVPKLFPDCWRACCGSAPQSFMTAAATMLFIRLALPTYFSI